MEIRLNEFCVDFSTPFIDKQAQIVGIKEKLDEELKNISVDKNVKKIDDSNLSIYIQLKTFRDIITKLNIVYNTSSKTKKITSVLNMGTPIIIRESEVLKDAEKEMKNNLTQMETEYQQNLEGEIRIPFTGKLYATDYVVLIIPNSFNSFDSILIQANIFKKYIDSESGKEFLKDTFMYVLTLSLGNVKVEDDAEETNKPEHIFTEISIEIPTIKRTVDNVNCDFDNTFFADVTLSFGKNSSLIQSTRNAVYLMAGDYKKIEGFKYFFGKSKVSDNIHVLTEVKKKRPLKGTINSYNGTIKLTYIYGAIFFPFYLAKKDNGLINFNVCNNSEDRTKFGYFTKGALNKNINKDAPFNENKFNFNGFFTLDSVEFVKEIDVKQEDLPFPKFETD